MKSKKQKQKPKTRMNEVMAIIDAPRTRLTLIAFIAVLGVSYLWLVNSSATDGFYVTDLETSVVALEDEYQKLDLELAAVQSAEHIEKQSEGLQLVSAGNVQYIDVDTAVAFNE